MNITWLNRIAAVLAVAFLALVPVTAQAQGTYAHSAHEEHATEEAENTIVDVAVKAEFNTLVAAVKAAGLAETLQGEGPFTVFAPTEEAFAKLPDGTLESLLKPENKDQLVAILTYHVVPGEVTSGEVVQLASAETVQGAPLEISVKDGTVMVNDATVTAVDVQASNGVIHVIDTVLLPPSE